MWSNGGGAKSGYGRNTATPDLDSVLVGSESLVSHVGRRDGVPFIQQSVYELEAGSRALGASATAAAAGHALGGGHGAAERAAEERGQRFLNQQNVDTAGIKRNVESLRLHAAHEPTRPLGVTDINGYLQHHHDMIILTATEEARKAAEDTALLQQREWEQEDWRSTKQRILSEMGLASSAWRPAQPAAATASVALGDGLGELAYLGAPAAGVGGGALAAGPPPLRSILTEDDLLHAEVVKALNEAVYEGSRDDGGGGGGDSGTIRVTTRFAEVAEVALRSGGRGANGSRYLRAWRLLAAMLEPPGDRQPAAFTQNPAAAAAAGARRFLQDEFLEVVRARVRTAEQQSLLRDPPSRASPERKGDATVRAYVELLNRENRLNAAPGAVEFEGQPLWAQVFYMLRCGLARPAADFLEAAANAGVPEPAAAAAAKVLLGDGARFELDALDEEYSRLYCDVAVAVAAGANGAGGGGGGGDGDPGGGGSGGFGGGGFGVDFKKVVLEIAREAGPQKVSAAVEGTIEDYMWFRLCFVAGGGGALWSSGEGSFEPDHSGAGTAALSLLQETIKRWGAEHFDGAGINPFAYVDVLFLSQLFGPAVRFLKDRGSVVEVIHFAVALDYQGALVDGGDGRGGGYSGYHGGYVVGLGGGGGRGGAAMDAGSDEALFCELMTAYAKRLQRTDPIWALHYLLRLWRPGADPSRSAPRVGRDAVFDAAILALFRETRRYDLLAGAVGRNGRRTRTAPLDRNLPPAEVEWLLLGAAEDAEARGATADAIELHALGERYGNVLRLYCDRLAAALGAEAAARRRWWERAEVFRRRHLAVPTEAMEDALRDPAVEDFRQVFEVSFAFA
ncbi:unnamed protein product [Phaeothamnion confervicola]